MDRGDWQNTVYGVAKTWTLLSNYAHSASHHLSVLFQPIRSSLVSVDREI